MNIVQSFWSLPSLSNQIKDEEYNRFCGGWLNEKYHAIGWAYSLLLLKKYHPGDKKILYTDNTGFDWLVNKIGLEYNEVHNELDVMNKYSSILWAIAKIYTYSRQEEPFLHVDGDIFIWKPIDKNLLSQKLIVQNFELGHQLYKQLVEEGEKIFSNIPDFIQGIDSSKDIVSINAGILGGNDIPFIKQYCKVVFDFIDANHDIITRSRSLGSFNMYFEQLFFAQLAIANNKSANSIGSLLKDNEGQLYNLTRFGIVPQSRNYIHMIGQSKAMPFFVSHMEQRFRFEFPKMYQHIQQLYRTVSVYSVIKEINTEESLPAEYKAAREEQFSECKKLIAELGHDTKNIDDHKIELLIEENISDLRFYKLWDVYQLESINLNIEKFIEYEEDKAFNYLYNYSIDEFMDVPFRLNTDTCKIIYLFHNWNYSKKKGEYFFFGENRLFFEASTEEDPVLTPWLVAQSYTDVELIKMNAWHSIFRYFEEGFISGNEIIKQLADNEHIVTEKETLKYDLYDFLTSQYMLFNRIIPASNQFSKS